jgi:hypothetical protein
VRSPNVFYRPYNSPPLEVTVKHTDDEFLLSLFFSHFNLILPTALMSRMWYQPLIFSDEYVSYNSVWC